MQTQIADFFQIHLGEALVLGGLLINWLKYRRERKNDADERARLESRQLEEQTRMHSENTQKLENLTRFQEEQMKINSRRDEQINELKNQTIAFIEIAKATNRRLEMLEDRD